MVDYSKLKTPFFEIKVGPSTANDASMIDLPAHLLRLVEKIEILEAITSETCLNSKIAITFREGSREPFSISDQLGDDTLYGSDTTYTNKPGMLTDLRFIERSGGGIGLSSITPNLVGQAQNIATQATDLVGILSGADDKVDSIVSESKVEPGPVRYLFQERNRINVTWGYKEDPESTRTLRGYITVVQSNFPEKGQPSTTINCFTGGYAMDQLSSGTGIQFYNSDIVGVDESGQPLKNFTGLTVKEILEKLVNEWGITATISSEFINNEIPAEKAHVLVPDQSPAEFIRNLAKEVNAVTEFQLNGDGNDHLLFLSRQDFNQLVLNDIDALSYKAAGSILKNIKILADFSSTKGYKGSFINKTGKLVESENQGDSKTAVQLVNKGQQEGQLDTVPTSNNPVNVAQQFQEKTSKNSSAVPSTKIHPRTEDQAKLVGTSEARSARCNEKLINMEFTAIGYPSIRPGAAIFGGIGNRYSGLYSIINVTHMINPNGYTLTGNAQSHSLAEGGARSKKASKVNKEEEVDRTSIQLTEPGAVDLSKVDPSDIF